MKNEYEVRGDITAIFLNKNDGTVLETLIDTTDIDKVKDYRWYASWISESWRVTGHSDTTRNSKTIILHRLLFENPKGFEVDHINGDPLDNRRSVNLRLVDKVGNGENRIRNNKNNTSGYRGVTWHKVANKWAAQLHPKGKCIYLGLFDDKEEARKVVEEARAKLMPKSREAMNANS